MTAATSSTMERGLCGTTRSIVPLPGTTSTMAWGRFIVAYSLRVPPTRSATLPLFTKTLLKAGDLAAYKVHEIHERFYEIGSF
jgi:hypothetical protein